VITEELLEAACKLAIKPAAGMCSVAGPNVGEKAKAANRLSFNQKLKIAMSVCVAIFFCVLLLLLLVEDPGNYVSQVAERRVGEGSIPSALSNRLRKWDSEKRIDGPPARAPAIHGMGVLFKQGRCEYEWHIWVGVSNLQLNIFA